MKTEAFFDPVTFTLTFLVYDPESRDAVVIDPVLDYDPLLGKLSTESVDKLLARVGELDLKVHYCLETHAHAWFIPCGCRGLSHCVYAA